MTSTFRYGARLFKLYFECWIYLYSLKYSWALFLSEVKLLVNSLILSRIYFKLCLVGPEQLFSLGPAWPHYQALFWEFCLMSHALQAFFIHVWKNMNSFWPSASYVDCFICPYKQFSPGLQMVSLDSWTWLLSVEDLKSPKQISGACSFCISYWLIDWLIDCSNLLSKIVPCKM